MMAVPIVFIAAGLSFLCAAAFLSAAAIEETLLGQATGSLAWGPTLFRVLLAIHGAAIVVAGSYRLLHRDRSLVSSRVERDTGRSVATGSWLILGALCVVAAGLRMWRLDSCLWYDEIDTLVHIVRQPLGRIVTTFASQNQHMFFSVLAHLCVTLFGESAAAVRLPSVVFGVGSIVALFLLGRRTIGVRASLLACSLMTVSYHHVWFSQNARGYMGLLFFTLLATWLWLEARARSTAGWWIAYAVSLAMGTWMHMTMVFVAAAQAVVFVLLQIMDIRRADPSVSIRRGLVFPLGAWLLAGTLTLQLYALSLPEFLRTALHEVSKPSEWTNPLWVLVEGFRNLSHGGLPGIAAVAVGGLILLIGTITLFLKDRAAALIMLLPGVLAGGTMLALGHNLWPRFFFFCMGFAILLAILGAMQAPRLLPVGSWLSNRLRDRLGVSLALLMVVASCFMLRRNYAFAKQDFIGARDFVERMRQAEDQVAAVGLAGIAYRSYYAPQWTVVQTRAELDRMTDRTSPLWLVYTLPIEIRAYHPGIWEVLQHKFEVVQVFPGTLGDGAVIVCREKPSA